MVLIVSFWFFWCGAYVFWVEYDLLIVTEVLKSGTKDCDDRRIKTC